MPIRTIFSSFFALLLILWITPVHSEPGLLIPRGLPRIAIDPGHGGADDGARGPTGHLEKTVTLDLARQLVQILEDRFEVSLTRSDDYNISPPQRAAIANQAKAELFIALHTGAGFLHGANVRTVFYHSPKSGDAKMPSRAGTAANRQRWDMAQSPYKDQNLTLASTLKESLANLDDDTACKMRSAPLNVLEGVAMPAVLIEVGHLTHPAMEKQLRTAKGREGLARAIAQGVTAYFDALAVKANQ